MPKIKSHSKFKDMKQVPPANVLAEMCPSREVLRHVSGRWGMLVFWALRDGEKQRFSTIRRTITGISEKMLAQTLQQLEYDGFIERTVHPVVPPHVEYQLTALGAEFATRAGNLIGWLEDNFEKVMAARSRSEASVDRP